MRRFWLFLALLVLPVGAIWLMSSAEPTEDSGVTPQPVPERLHAAEHQAEDVEVIRPGHEPELPPVLLVDEALDLTGDGVYERLQLYVDAEQGADGRILWDDGQRWLVLVRAGGGYYTLFDEYVQIGEVRVWVVEEDGERAPRVLIMRDTGAGMELRSHRYVEPNGFSSATEFTLTGNVIYSSPQPR